MANEITYTLKIDATKNGAILAKVNSAGVQLTMSGSEGASETQVIATSATAITLGAVTIGDALVYFKNLDATNYVELAMDNLVATPFAKLKPGREAFYEGPASGTIYAKANASSVRIAKVFLSA